MHKNVCPQHREVCLSPKCACHPVAMHEQVPLAGQCQADFLGAWDTSLPSPHPRCCPQPCPRPASLACFQKGLWAGQTRGACHALLFQGITETQRRGGCRGRAGSGGPPGDRPCHPERTRRFPSGISKHRTLWGVCHPGGDRLSRQGRGGGGEGAQEAFCRSRKGGGEKAAGCWRPGSPQGGVGAGPGLR